MEGTSPTKASPRTGGDFQFGGRDWIDGNRQHLDAHSDLIGYGWRLGDWNAADKVESTTWHHNREVNRLHEGGTLLRREMLSETAHPAVNPSRRFNFDVAVKTGR